jgi:MerR family transcriptional regulator, mercuric resistance operon regulatory protein
MASGPFTLAALARAAGMGIDDVRFYRDRGLLQPARRRPGRSDDFAFQTDHLDRLHFIARALAYGLTLEDIAQLVDPASLMTCGDVCDLAERRLEQIRQSGAEAPGAAALAQLLDDCAGVGSRNDCAILATLAKRGG